MGRRAEATADKGAEDTMTTGTTTPCTCHECLLDLWLRDRAGAIALATRRLQQRGAATPTTLRKSA